MKADHEIVKEVQNGNLSLFSELVARHQRALLRLALRMTRDMEAAEDIVQDSFVKALQKIGTFEMRSSFKSWIYQITLNTARNKLRKKKHEFLDGSNVCLGVESEMENNMCIDDVKKTIQTEVEKLPSKQRMALTLRIFDDLSFKEISEIMNCPYDTAKANYRHAVLKLRHHLAKDLTLKNWNIFDNTTVFTARQRSMEAES